MLEWFNPRIWRDRLTSIPVWIGGLRPNATMVTLVDRSETPNRVVLSQLTSNQEGVVEARIPNKYKCRLLDLLINDTWFENQATNVAVERYGLYRSVMLERDYTYLPGGEAVNEKPPTDGIDFDPVKAHETASTQVQAQVRAKVNRIPLWFYNALIAVLSAYLVALIANAPVIGIFVLPIASFGARAFMFPYLSGHKKTTGLVKAIGILVPLALLVVIIFLQAVLAVPGPLTDWSGSAIRS